MIEEKSARKSILFRAIVFNSILKVLREMVFQNSLQRGGERGEGGWIGVSKRLDQCRLHLPKWHISNIRSFSAHFNTL